MSDVELENLLSLAQQGGKKKATKKKSSKKMSKKEMKKMSKKGSKKMHGGDLEGGKKKSKKGSKKGSKKMKRELPPKLKAGIDLGKYIRGKFPGKSLGVVVSKVVWNALNATGKIDSDVDGALQAAKKIIDDDFKSGKLEKMLNDLAKK